MINTPKILPFQTIGTVLLLLAVLVFGIPEIHAQRPAGSDQTQTAVDLSGIWEAPGGLSSRIVQEGQKVTGYLFDFPPQDGLEYGFKKDDITFRGTIQGNRLHGEAYRVYPLVYNMKHCHYWQQISYTISPDGNQSDGVLKLESRDPKTCEVRGTQDVKQRYLRRIRAREVRIVPVSSQAGTISGPVQDIAAGDSFVAEVLFDLPPGRVAEVNVKWGGQEHKVQVFRVLGSPNVFRSKPIKVFEP